MIKKIDNLAPAEVLRIKKLISAAMSELGKASHRALKKKLGVKKYREEMIRRRSFKKN